MTADALERLSKLPRYAFDQDGSIYGPVDADAGTFIRNEDFEEALALVRAGGVPQPETEPEDLGTKFWLFGELRQMPNRWRGESGSKGWVLGKESCAQDVEALIKAAIERGRAHAHNHAGIRSVGRAGDGPEDATTNAMVAPGVSPSSESRRAVAADESGLRAGRDQQSSTARDSSPHGPDTERLYRPDLARLVEQLCKFNCDAESSCRCAAHEMYRAARAGGVERTPEIRCRHCGEDIRLIDGDWLDRETHSVCGESTQKHEPIDQSEDGTLVGQLTAIVREADATFQRVGGSSRHWVRDCFLPLLNQKGWIMARGAVEPPAPCANGHTWTNQFGDDWTPERGAMCDCRKKAWGVEPPAQEPEFDWLPAVEARCVAAAQVAGKSWPNVAILDTRIASALKDIPMLVAEIKRLRGARPSPPVTTQECELGEGHCNPFRASCGAKFCTPEEAIVHHQVYHAAAPHGADTPGHVKV